MNKIRDDLTKNRNGHYTHCVELATAYELEVVIYSLVGEFYEEYSIPEIKDFFNTLSIYYYTEEENSDDEKELYDFSVSECVDQAINELL